MEIADPWDFGEMYGALYDWVRQYRFDPDTEQYWTHITTGTHVAQICMFLLVESRFIPGVLLQTSPPKRRSSRKPGSFTLIDLDLSRYDVLARRMHTGNAAPHADAVDLESLLGADAFAALDLFDRVQLEAVIGVCREARTLSEAGRKLIDRSRAKRSVVNDADRLRKYLQKFGLSWKAVSAPSGS